MNTTACRHAIVSALMLFAAFALQPARAEGLVQVHYPTTDAAQFIVSVPADWKLTPQGEAGAEDYFEVGGPNGLELSFRTVPGADMEKAVADHIAYLKENFSAVKVGTQVETKINGMDAIILPAVATDEDESERDIGAGWFLISDSAIGELWYNVDKTDQASKSAASAVLNSLKKG